MDDLKHRVNQFCAMELPGQPRAMHMGTSYLINDLWREVTRLRAGIEQEAGFNAGLAAMAARPEWRDYHEVLSARLRALLEPQG